MKNEGFRLIAFSNGKSAVLESQLKFAGLSAYFDNILSVDAVKKYKPHPDAYSYVLEESGLAAKSTMMVAAHGWDITGAMRAGLRSAFVKRSGKFVFPLAKKPDLIIPDIETLAQKLKDFQD